MKQAVFVALLCASFAVGQQPNSTGASQFLNGLVGPPWPVQQVALPVGVPVPFSLQGAPNATFITFASQSVVTSGGFPVLGGQLVDIDLATLVTLFDGTTNPAFRLDGTGAWQVVATPDANVSSVGQVLGVQTLIEDPGNIAGATLTAAHEGVISPGITVVPLSLGDDSSVLFSLTPYGFQVPFYQSSYSDFYVASNGMVCFNQQSNDFTSTPTEFLQQMPRIAMFWCDLSPNISGTISVEIDESTPIKVARVKFDAVPEFGLSIPHTFSTEMDALGTVNIINSPFNPGPATYTLLTGVSPGGNLSPVTSMLDLTALATAPITGQQDQAIFEWFGTTSMINWTLMTSNPFDMTGRTLSLTPVTPGVYFAATL